MTFTAESMRREDLEGLSNAQLVERIGALNTEQHLRCAFRQRDEARARELKRQVAHVWPEIAVRRRDGRLRMTANRIRSGAQQQMLRNLRGAAR